MEQILKIAFNELDKNDVVLGPAEDGGYYLLGMNSLQETIWGVVLGISLIGSAIINSKKETN